jgi:hypothetical protein
MVLIELVEAKELEGSEFGEGRDNEGNDFFSGQKRLADGEFFQLLAVRKELQQLVELFLPSVADLESAQEFQVGPEVVGR